MSDNTKTPTVPPVSRYVRYYESGIGRNPGKPFMVTAQTRLKIDTSGDPDGRKMFGRPVVFTNTVKSIELTVGNAAENNS